MALAAITSKEQITIPKSVRDRLKLKAGDKIDIIIAEKNQAIFRPALGAKCLYSIIKSS